ncbi:MAG TPA: hypothetical protein VG125_23190 [Pirellulales bacterium]|jgi:hypothetical protein|nr:hypothetical protein [Pirellulales bacterium]
MRLAVSLFVASMFAPILGCAPAAPAPKAGPPPFKVSFRKSQIPGEGMVANVNNASSTESITVEVVFVQGKEEKEERSYRLGRPVKPLDSIPVGWAELGGWKLKSGDKLRIRCGGYSADLNCEVAN